MFYDGVRNFLCAINENWTTIVVLVGIGIGVYKKVRAFLKLSNKEKEQLAWRVIDETILSMVSDAELNYETWKQAGALKRSQVIDRIFAEFPILLKVSDSKSVIKRIDRIIDNALMHVMDIVDKNNEYQLVNKEEGKENEGYKTLSDKE